MVTKLLFQNNINEDNTNKNNGNGNGNDNSLSIFASIIDRQSNSSKFSTDTSSTNDSIPMSKEG